MFVGWDILEWKCYSKACCCVSNCLIRGSRLCSDSESVEEVLGPSCKKEDCWEMLCSIGIVGCYWCCLEMKIGCLTYTGVVIQDCLNKSFTCFFMNRFRKYQVSKALDKDVLRESSILSLICEITILSGPCMTWWCQCCRCPIHSYNVVLAIARSNKSSGIPHSTARDNENWWGVDNTVQSNESRWLRLQWTMSLVAKKEVLS